MDQKSFLASLEVVVETRLILPADFLVLLLGGLSLIKVDVLRT